VHYLADPNHPDAAVIRRLLPEGSTARWSRSKSRTPTKEDVFRFMDKLKLVVRGTSLGDVHSLLLYPAIASHREIAPKQRQRMGIGDGLVRLCAGIEAVEDIIADLDQASEAEIALRSSETCRVHTSVHAARRSVPIAFRTTMVMKIKDLPAAASFTFEGACATGLASTEPCRDKSARKRARQRGNTILESALIFLPLMAFCFGIVDVSLAIFIQSTLTTASREGTRLAITFPSSYNGTSCAGSQSTCIAQAVQYNAVGLPSGLASSYITVNYYTANDLSNPVEACKAGSLFHRRLYGFGLPTAADAFQRHGCQLCQSARQHRAGGGGRISLELAGSHAGILCGQGSHAGR
jgi:hypothetical protein